MKIQRVFFQKDPTTDRSPRSTRGGATGMSWRLRPGACGGSGGAPGTGRGGAPEQRLRLVAGVPQVLQEAEHDAGRAAAGAEAWHAPGRHLHGVELQQAVQHPPPLPAPPPVTCHLAVWAPWPMYNRFCLTWLYSKEASSDMLGLTRWSSSRSWRVRHREKCQVWWNSWKHSSNPDVAGFAPWLMYDRSA